MLDSAIDTGFASSDDDAVSIKSGRAVKNFGILRKANLMDDIKEQPSPIKQIQKSDQNRLNSRNSVKSLEWFDE
uniref:Uncharacterized protein n=1 Tax=Panagrolaimus sp. JU765 TaxID=591449 RepID=A0AC34RSB0_9BILA